MAAAAAPSKVSQGLNFVAAFFCLYYLGKKSGLVKNEFQALTLAAAAMYWLTKYERKFFFCHDADAIRANPSPP